MMIRLIFLIGACATLASAQEPLTWRTTYQVGALETPREEVFDSETTDALAPDASLFVGESREGRIHSFDPRGRYLGSFGRFGRGPGEFRYITSLAPFSDGDSLYVWDHKNRRVSVIATDTRAVVRDFRLPLSIAGPVRMRRAPQGLLVFVGPVAGSDSLIHLVSQEGHHLRSMGGLLNRLDPPVDNPQVAAQLNLAQFCLSPSGDLLVGLQAPYILARYSLNGELRWLVRDDLLPDPRAKHIIAEPMRYEVSVYPVLTGIYCLSREKILVVATDFEEEERYWDIRSADDGTLIHRYRTSIDQHPSEILVGDDGASGLGSLYHPEPFPRYIVGRWSLRPNQ